MNSGFDDMRRRCCPASLIPFSSVVVKCQFILGAIQGPVLIGYLPRSRIGSRYRFESLLDFLFGDRGEEYLALLTELSCSGKTNCAPPAQSKPIAVSRAKGLLPLTPYCLPIFCACPNRPVARRLYKLRWERPSKVLLFLAWTGRVVPGRRRHR